MSEVYDSVTSAVMARCAIAEQYLGRAIIFETLCDGDGLALFRDKGERVVSETRDITGTVIRRCRYPFRLVRCAAPTSEAGRLAGDDELESLGAWLCGESAVLGGELREPEALPVMSGGRRIIRFVRGSVYGGDPGEDGVSDRVLPFMVECEETSRRG